MIWIWRIFGILSIFLAVLGIFPALLSGAALGLVLIVLVLSGLTALSGNIKYALVVLAITTINLSFSFLTSPVPGWGRGESLGEKTDALLFYSIPYTITIFLIIIGDQIKRYRGVSQPPKKRFKIIDPYLAFVIVYFIFVFVWLFRILSKGFSSLMMSL